MQLVKWALSLSVLLVGGIAQAVDVVGIIDQDTRWDAAQNPYVVTGELIVDAPATLTIEPGVEVRVRGAGTRILVNGRLVIAGEAGNRVVIRPDGAEAPGSYEGVFFNNNSTGEMRHTDILWANNPLRINGPGGARHVFVDVAARDYQGTGLHLLGGQAVALSTLTLDGGGTGERGLFVEGTPLTLTNATITDHRGAGVQMRDDPATFERVVLARNVEQGILFEQFDHRNVDHRVEHCTLYANGDGIRTHRQPRGGGISLTVTDSILGAQTGALISDGGGQWRLSNLPSFNQNVWWGPTGLVDIREPVDFGTSLRANALLADPDNGDYAPTDRSPTRYWSRADPNDAAGALPYAGALTGAGLHGYWYEDRTFEARSVNDLPGDMVITAGTTITFRPDARVRAAAADAMHGGLDIDRVEIRVEGTLEADGTNSRPVQFTSAAAAPAPGDWYGIVIPSDAEAFNIAQVDIGYTFRGVSLYENDHIVAGAVIHDCSDAGVWINGGTPEVEQTTVERCAIGVNGAEGATIALRGLVARQNVQDGIKLHNTSALISDSVLHDNGNHGIGARVDDPRQRDWTVICQNCTIAHNAVDGVNAQGGFVNAGDLDIELHSSSITHNLGLGYHSERGWPSITCTYSNLWGNQWPWQIRQYQPLWDGYGSRGSLCFVENPLYADADARNYEPTHRSPLRAMGANGGHVGALPHVDAMQPELVGVLWEDFDFIAAESPYTLVGDIIVPSGVSVTFEPGVVLNVEPQTDLMGGRPSTERIDLRFLTNSTVLISGQPDAPVHFRSAAQAPSPGDWGGLVFDDARMSEVLHTRIDYPDVGVRVFGSFGPPLTHLEVRYADTAGIEANSVRFGDQLQILGARIIGAGDGIGIDVNDSISTIRSSYITHHAVGIDVYQEDNFANDVHLVNNTVVHADDCLRVGRRAGFINLALHLTNNLLANCRDNWIRDAEPDHPTSVHARRNLHFPQHANEGVVFAENIDPILDDPHIEDDDWQPLPRWWDGRVWRQSPAVNTGVDDLERLPAVDVTGRARNFAGGVDIGAYEFDPDANEDPRADPVAESRMIPRGERVDFDGRAAFDPDGEIVDAFWTMSDGTTIGGLVASHTFPNDGAHHAFLTVTDDAGAEDHALVDLNVNIRPVADAGPEVFQDVGPAESVFFDGTLSADPDGEIVAWAWDFGDGSPIDATPTPRHSYLNAGLYTVRLTVTDNEGLTHTDTTLATVFGDEDIVGPLIEHEAIDTLALGEPLVVRATIRDPAGVDSAVVFHRAPGGAAQFVVMQPQGEDLFEAVIPAERIQAPILEYWITALDAVQPDPNASFAPPGAPDDGVFEVDIIGELDPPVIEHVPVANGQPAAQAVDIEATLTDASGIESATVFFRTQGAQAFGTAPMNRIAGDRYAAQIPAFVVGNGSVEYYIEARDQASAPNIARSPVDAPATVHRFTVQNADQAPPIIGHAQVADGQPVGEAVSVTANVIDATSAIASVVLHYRVADVGPYMQLPMMRINDSMWQGMIPDAAVREPAVQYYIEALDAAGNRATAPADAPAAAHRFTVRPDDRVGPALQHVPVADGRLENAPVTIEALADDPAGVATVRLYYRPTGFPFYQETAMRRVDESWVGTIPGFSVQRPAVEYYLRATDANGNQSFSPAAAPDVVHAFTVDAVDEGGPDILHTPPEAEQAVGIAVQLSATVTDDSGVAGATVFTRTVDTVVFDSHPMALGDDGRWHVDVPAEAIEAPGLEYYFEAVDQAEPPNASRAPQGDGIFRLAVVAPDDTPPVIQLAAVEDGRPTGADVFVRAEILDDGVVAAAQLWVQVAGVWQASAMRVDGNQYQGTIPAAQVVPPAVAYYVTATDATGNTAIAPATAPEQPARFTVEPVEMPDMIGPQIAVDAVPARVDEGVAIDLNATVRDPSGVAQVEMRYRSAVTGGWLSTPMLPGVEERYSARIPAPAVVPDSVRFQVVAVDAVGNTSQSAEGFISVLPVDRIAPIIEHLPIEDAPRNSAIDIEMRASDDAGVMAARVWFRFDDSGWQSADLNPADDDLWEGVIPALATAGPQLEYTLQATDNVGNTAVLPAGAPDVAWRIEVFDPIEPVDMGMDAGLVGDMDVQIDMHVSRDAGLSDDSGLSNDMQLDSGDDAQAASDMAVSDDMTLQRDMAVSDDMTLQRDMAVSDDMTLQRDMAVSADAEPADRDAQINDVGLPPDAQFADMGSGAVSSGDGGCHVSGRGNGSMLMVFLGLLAWRRRRSVCEPKSAWRG